MRWFENEILQLNRGHYFTQSLGGNLFFMAKISPVIIANLLALERETIRTLHCAYNQHT